MKKILSLILIIGLVSITSVNAQDFKAGNKIVEGTAMVSTVTSKPTSVEPKVTTTTWSVAPSVGYFITNRFAVGVSGGVGETHEKEDGIEKKRTSSNISLGVFARCYFLNIGQHMKVFSQLDATNTNQSNDDATFSTGLGLGGNYFVSQKLALTAGLANLINYSDNGKTSSFSAGFTGVNNPLSMAKFGVLYRF